MAERRAKKSKENVFWTAAGATLSKRKLTESVVPGVTDIGNMRPRVKGGRTKEVKAMMPVEEPEIENLDLHGSSITTGLTFDSATGVDSEPSNLSVHGKQVSLRDLCAEDKQRVANLIKELARVGEEKENAEVNLKAERQHYEEQILKLVEQQEQILIEREEVQKKLSEYQTYIFTMQQQPQPQQPLQQPHAAQKNHEEWRNEGSNNNNINNNNSNKKNGKISNSPLVPTHPVSSVRQDRTPHLHRQPPRPPPPSIPAPNVPPFSAEEEDQHMEDDSEEEATLEGPSKVIYLNELEETGVTDLSTRALPPQSPQTVLDSVKLRLQRPFTAMIDKELAHQRQLLAAATASGADVRSAQAHINDGGRNADELRRASARKSRDDQACVTGNTALLTPEKSELMGRFIESQREAMRTKLSGSPNERTLEKKMEKEKIDRRKVKGKKRPPPSLGPLHPPIMSSTQKSSEFADVLSVDSTVVSDRPREIIHDRKPARNAKDAEDHGRRQRSAVDGGELYRAETKACLYTGDGGFDKARDNDKPDEDGRVIEDRLRGDRTPSRKKNKQKDKPHVEFSDVQAKYPPTSPQMALQLQTENPDFLYAYKQMSASERKKELVRQRALLLEEQSRLKRILADQEHQLKLKKQQADMDLEEKVRANGSEEDTDMKEMKTSLATMERDLLRKEEELKRERQLLAQRWGEEKGKALRSQAVANDLGGESDEQTGRGSKMKVSPRKLTLTPVDKAKDVKAFTTEKQPQGDGAEDVDSHPGTKNACAPLYSEAHRSAKGRNPSRHNPRQQVKADDDLLKDEKPGLESTKQGRNNNNLRALHDQAVEHLHKLSSGALARGGRAENSGKAVQEGSDEDDRDKQIRGSDGDGCILYPPVLKHESDRSEDGVVKKLDYSLHSDTESELSANKNSPPSHAPTDEVIPSLSDVIRPSRQEMVDVGTSISYSHLPRERNSDGKKGISPVKKTEKKKPGRPNNKQPLLQPGDKTLSVMEIINSMADRATSSSTGKTATTTSTTTNPRGSSRRQRQHPETNAIIRNQEDDEDEAVLRHLIQKASRSKARFEYAENDPTTRGELMASSPPSPPFNFTERLRKFSHLAPSKIKSSTRMTAVNSRTRYPTSLEQGILSGNRFGVATEEGLPFSHITHQSASSASSATLNNPLADPNLDLFELKRGPRGSATVHRDKFPVGNIYVDGDYGDSSNIDVDDLYLGVCDGDEDSNIDEIVNALDDLDNDEEVVVDYEDKDEGCNSDNNNYDDDIIDVVIKQFGQDQGQPESDEEEDLREDDDVDDEMPDDDNDIVKSSFEESQILEDVFFVKP